VRCGILSGVSELLAEDPGPTCAFCRSGVDVGVQERLGVSVAVCAACATRFAGARTSAPAPRRERAVADPALPPTIGQGVTAVAQHVARMAEKLAARPYRESTCGRCDADVEVYRDPAGADVVLAPQKVLADVLPLGDRWRVDEGRAVLLTEDDPDQVGARLLHALVCAAEPAPVNARLRQVWKDNTAAS
jgi:hypothetical protein